MKKSGMDSKLLSQWVKSPLDAIATTTSGGTPNRKRPDYYGGGIPWVKSGELNDSYIFETEETLTQEGLKNSSAKLFPAGTLLIAMYGATVGKTASGASSAFESKTISGIHRYFCTGAPCSTAS
jgi:type I restriction enzyme S subunit